MSAIAGNAIQLPLAIIFSGITKLVVGELVETGGGVGGMVGTSGTVQIGGRVHGRVPLGGPQATWLKLEPPSVVREECFQDAGCFKAP